MAGLSFHPFFILHFLYFTSKMATTCALFRSGLTPLPPTPSVVTLTTHIRDLWVLPIPKAPLTKPNTLPQHPVLLLPSIKSLTLATPIVLQGRWRYSYPHSGRPQPLVMTKFNVRAAQTYYSKSNLPRRSRPPSHLDPKNPTLRAMMHPEE
jgi:hypothetical protein